METSREVLGWCVCVAGTVYKVPQVVKIKRAESAEGVSPAFFGLDAISNAIELAFSIRNKRKFFFEFFSRHSGQNYTYARTQIRFRNGVRFPRN
jgi:uncharacterized protein with PQ loop repeat